MISKVCSDSGIKDILRVGAAFSLLAASVFVGACGNGQTVGAPPPVPVLVDTVKVANVPFEVRSIGTLEPYNTVAVKALVGGQLKKVYFEEGQDVSRGDMLFLIDPAPFQAALENARSQLVRDSVSWVNAAETVKRYGDLVQKEYITAQDYSDMVARAQSLKATVAADRANVDNASLNLQYCSVRSPLEGRTGRRMADEGNIIRANADDALVIINQIRPIYVDFTTPESILREIQTQSSRRELTVQAFPPNGQDSPYEGRLSFIDNAVDESTGTVRMKATFPNADQTLWPGQFVNVRLILKTLDNVTVVPSQAIQTGQDGHFVFLVGTDMSVESRPVNVSYERDNLSVVDQGLKLGEVVVTDGQLRLRPGSKVEIKSGLTAATGGNQNEEAAGR